MTRNTVYLLSIFIFLIGFTLRILNSNWEPYPAVLMPVGANTAKINGNNIEVNRISLLVSKDNADWEVLDGSSFERDRTFKNFRLVSSEFYKMSKLECQTGEISQAKEWLRNQLQLNNLPDKYIRYKKSKVNLNRNTRTIIDEKDELDFVIDLYDCN